MKSISTCSYTLTIKYYNSGSSDQQLDLTLTNNKITTLNKDANGKETKLEAIISSLYFKRKLYEPNEIIAEVSLMAMGKYERPTLSELRTMFFRKPVELKITSQTTYKKDSWETETPPEEKTTELKLTHFFVYEFIPKYKASGEASKSVELTLKIFSLDKLMSIDKYSQAYLGRKLRGEILKSVDRFQLGYSFKDQDNNSRQYQVEFNDNFIVSSDSDSTHVQDYKLQHLAYQTTERTKNKNGTNYIDKQNKQITRVVQNEFIQPYLVQYNESFYNFIKRIANRCGEFLYFDNGMLHIGLQTTPDENGLIPKDDPYVTKLDEKNKETLYLKGYSSLSFDYVSPGVLSVNDYARDSAKLSSESLGESTTPNYPSPKQYRQEEEGKQIYKFSGEEGKVSLPKNTNLFSDGFKTGIDEIFTGKFNFNTPHSLSKTTLNDNEGKTTIKEGLESYTDLDDDLEINNNGFNLKIQAPSSKKNQLYYYKDWKWNFAKAKKDWFMAGTFLKLQPGSKIEITSTYPIESIILKFNDGNKGSLKDQNNKNYSEDSTINIDSSTPTTQFTLEVSSKSNTVNLNEISINSIKESKAEEGSPEKYFYNNEIAHDEFFMPLYKDGWGGNSWWDLNMGNYQKNIVSWGAMLLNSVSLFDFLAGIAADVVKKSLNFLLYKNEMGERTLERFIKPYSPSYQPNIPYTHKHIPYVIPFSEDELKRWTTLEYYSGIKVYEERQQRLMATIDMDTNLSNLHLGDIFLLSEDGTTPYVACEIEINIKSDEKGSTSPKLQQIIKAIPMLHIDNGWKAYPPVIDEDVFRKSGPQTAFVIDSADPKRQNRVRIRYPWQTSSANMDVEDLYIPTDDAALKNIWDNYNKMRRQAASPWIRMATPSATEDAGIYFEAEPGDEVIVNYENDNIERPYVVGTLYSKEMPAPAGKGRRVIVSKFGHMIRFNDPSTGPGEMSDYHGAQKVIDGLGTLGTILNPLITVFGASFPIDKLNVTNNLTGGIDITDTYGLYKISMSSDERSISIASPFGDVAINAFTGISINAPNGDISICGKNVNIEASNNVNIVSGSNLLRAKGGLYDTQILNWAAQDDNEPGSFIDVTLIRTIVEFLIRPVEGVLTVKSHGYLKLEAGQGEAQIESSKYEDRWRKNFQDPDKDDEYGFDQLKSVKEYLSNLDLVVNEYYTIFTTLYSNFVNQLKSFFTVHTPELRNFNNLNQLLQHYYTKQNHPVYTMDDFKDEIKNNNFDVLKARKLRLLNIDSKLLHTSLRQLLNFCSSSDTITNLVAPSYKNFTNELRLNLINELKKEYNNNTVLFGFEREIKRDAQSLNAFIAQNDVNVYNPEINANWKANRNNIKRLLSKKFFKSFSDFYFFHKIQFSENVNIMDDQSWNHEVNNFDITYRWGVQNVGSSILNFIKDRTLPTLKSLGKGINVWKNGEESNGKILMSDRADKTVYLESDPQNQTYRFNNRNNILRGEEAKKALRNEIIGILHNFV